MAGACAKHQPCYWSQTPYNAAHNCVTTNMVYATSLHIIPHITQKKDFAYELPKDLMYKLKKVSAYKLVENQLA